MPIFEYKCNDCGHRMEFLEKQVGNHICEKCKGSNLQKLFSGFSVGHSKPSTPGCETCRGGLPPADSCPTGTCPFS
ncbi:MAG: zinc ribbon domain-containing protein [Planctomycetota bacterium]|nr:zinc ribbon domain-containing protein [Planctomycetota bacterium]